MCSHGREPGENKHWVRTVRCMVVLFSPLGDPRMLFFNFCTRLKFTSDSIWKKSFSKATMKNSGMQQHIWVSQTMLRKKKTQKEYPLYDSIYITLRKMRISLVAQMESVCLQWGRPWFDPWAGKIPWRRKWQPTPILLPGESHGWRSLAGYSPWGRKESDMTERLYFLLYLL